MPHFFLFLYFIPSKKSKNTQKYTLNQIKNREHFKKKEWGENVNNKNYQKKKPRKKTQILKKKERNIIFFGKKKNTDRRKK